MGDGVLAWVEGGARDASLPLTIILFFYFRLGKGGGLENRSHHCDAQSHASPGPLSSSRHTVLGMDRRHRLARVEEQPERAQRATLLTQQVTVWTFRIGRVHRALFNLLSVHVGKPRAGRLTCVLTLTR